MYRPTGRRALLRGIGARLTAAVAGRAATAAAVPAPGGFERPLRFHSPPMRPFVDELPRPPVVPDASFFRLGPAMPGAAHAAHRDAGLRFVRHCRLLDHEDHDMMLRLRTVR